MHAGLAIDRRRCHRDKTFDVRAGAKRARPGSLYDDDAHRGVGIGGKQRRRQLLAYVFVDRVHRVRPVQRDPRHLSARFG